MKLKTDLKLVGILLPLLLLGGVGIAVVWNWQNRSSPPPVPITRHSSLDNPGNVDSPREELAPTPGNQDDLAQPNPEGLTAPPDSEPSPPEEADHERPEKTLTTMEERRAFVSGYLRPNYQELAKTSGSAFRKLVKSIPADLDTGQRSILVQLAQQIDDASVAFKLETNACLEAYLLDESNPLSTSQDRRHLPGVSGTIVWGATGDEVWGPRGAVVTVNYHLVLSEYPRLAASFGHLAKLQRSFDAALEGHVGKRSRKEGR